MATTQVTAKCQRCGRILTDPKRVATGLGRTCQAKIAEAAKALEQPAGQVEKAVELIEDGALVHWTRDLFVAVSNDGVTVYEVDAAAGSCTCPAGVNGRHCYHRIAAEIVQASVGVPAATKPAALARPADPFAVFASAA
jgi:Family of unknown function (DUF6011)